jgi:hypothetical protein
MLDRAISGSGAVTDAADRAVRQLLGGAGRQFTATRSGSLLVVAVLVGLAALLVVAGLEATDPPQPMAVAPAIAASAGGLGDRTYAQISGSVDAAYVETYLDVNDNRYRDDAENSVTWYYWIVDAQLRSGVTVRSTRSPAEIYTFSGTGRVVENPHFRTYDRRALDREVAAEGLELDTERVIDATSLANRAQDTLDLTAGPPAIGSLVRFDGPRLGSWTAVCPEDPDHDGVCDLAEQESYEIVILDPVTRRAIRVLTADLPEFTGVTMTGVLRREERAVDEALTTEGLDFDDLGLTVSDRFILDDGAGPGSATLAFVAAGVALGLAGVILVGLAGGYLVYRRDDGSLPAPATTLAADDRIPLRVTGVLKTAAGPEHVREVPASLGRVPVRVARPPVPRHGTGPAEIPEVPDVPDALGTTPPDIRQTPGPEAPATDDGDAATTLVVERTNGLQGLEVGLGHVARISTGSAVDARGPRPAIRLKAGTGSIILSFDMIEERDRAAAEILGEAGLGPDGKQPPIH